MTNYSRIEVAEKNYQRTDKNITCKEFKLKDNLEKESFMKFLSNIKSAFKGSQIKVYYSKAIFEKDDKGNFIPNPKRPGFNKSHGGFLVETGEKFDEKAILEAIKAIDKTLDSAIKADIYKVKVVTKKVTKQEQIDRQAEEIARLKNLLDSKGIKY